MGFSSKQIAIIGAGPAGLMAAEILATAGHQVTVYDRMPSPGRKFLLAGRGGLNLTHSEPLEKFLSRYGAATEWLTPAVQAFSPEQLRAWCEGLGQETFVGSSGRVFPKVMKAAALLRAWLKRLEQLGVRYEPRYVFHGFEGARLRFTNPAREAVWITADATLLALGGASWPRLGSDGAWAAELLADGIPVAPLRPANCGFLVSWSEYFRERFAGMPLKPVTLSHGAMSRQGEAMITANGIEGGAVYAISSALRDTVNMQGSATMMLDLRPGVSLEALTQKLSTPRASKSFSTYLQKAGFSPLVIALLREVTPADELAQLSGARLAARLKALPLRVNGTTDLARAISTAGGVMRDAVTDDFMLRARPGVFVAGEMLDWEAPTGGYLLQCCFSTAVAAAHGMMQYCETC